MPLSAPAERSPVHRRVIDMQAYARTDGSYDVEAHLMDRKPYPFQRRGSPNLIPAGEPLHDLWIRMTVDADYVVRAIEVASDVTPHVICKETQTTLQVMVGEPLAGGWSSKVRERLKGAASCTHLKEMLLPLATTALQGMRGVDPRRLSEQSSDATAEKTIDSCYAYGRSTEVVKMLWPQHHRPR